MMIPQALALDPTTPIFLTAFFASFVEAVEAFTVVLAASTFQGWRPAWAGAALALLSLALLVLLFGPLLRLVPLEALRLVVGILILFFGLGWLRKAILRAAGLMPQHDEAEIYQRKLSQMNELQHVDTSARAWAAGLMAFKGVLLEGMEVAVIVLAVGADSQYLPAAIWASASACVLVIALGTMLSRPLSRIPENALKFIVGTMLSAFGLFWAGEGLNLHWPGDDLALVGLALTLALLSWICVNTLKNKHAIGKQAARLVNKAAIRPAKADETSLAWEVFRTFINIFFGDKRMVWPIFIWAALIGIMVNVTHIDFSLTSIVWMLGVIAIFIAVLLDDWSKLRC